jgi:hypothetical protein
MRFRHDGISAVAWNVVIAGTLTQLLVDLDWLVGDIAGPWANNRQFFVLLTSGCVLLPLVSIPTFHKLRFISSLSVASMLFVTFVVVFRVRPSVLVRPFECLAAAAWPTCCGWACWRARRPVGLV